MTYPDLVNKLASDHNLTTGRAEMIISILVERITERLVSEGQLNVKGFGNFTVVKNSLSQMILSDNVLNKNRVVFEPDDIFLRSVNG